MTSTLLNSADHLATAGAGFKATGGLPTYSYRASRLLIRSLLGCLLAVVLTTGTGCTITRGVSDQIHYNDAVNDMVLGWRNGAWALRSWHLNRYQYAGHPYFRHFGIGYRDGYASVAGGGDGCPPAIPPRRYWSWRYQSPEGQGKVAAWFEGFPHGAQAAEMDRAGEFQGIQVSHVIEAQYSPEFQAGKCPEASEDFFSPYLPPMNHGPLDPGMFPADEFYEEIKVLPGEWHTLDDATSMIPAPDAPAPASRKPARGLAAAWN